jgi:hypothetical protein
MAPAQQIREVRPLFPEHDFSVVLGGPTFQFFRRLHLTSDDLGRLRWRVLTITIVVWLPLLLLATLNYSAVNAGWLSFLRDIEVHVRFLIALPVLMAAELLVHSRLRLAVRCFVERGIVLPQDLPRFDRAIQSAIRLRNSIPLEMDLLILVYTLGLWLWQRRTVPDVSTWYVLPGGPWHLTPAGFWYVFVSIPIFQFILLRWYWRLFIWFRFLWHVSRINLNIVPTHPDRCAGLGFLGKSAYAFGPILFAQGSMLAALVASRVLYKGESLPSFKFEVVGFVGFFVLAILGPLVMFTPAMARARRKGFADYGLFAQRYVETFEQKWVIHSPASTEKLLGSPDIQSLADLRTSYALVREMRFVPFGKEDIVRLAAATAIPLLPLLLTIVSPEELIRRVAKFVLP